MRPSHARLAAGCVLQDIFLFDFRERKAELLVIVAGAGLWLDGGDSDFFHGDAEEVHRDAAGLAHSQYSFRYPPAVQAKSHQVGACGVHLVHDDEVLDSCLGCSKTAQASICAFWWMRQCQLVTSIMPRCCASRDSPEMPSIAKKISAVI